MEYHSGGSLPLLGRPRYCPGASANGGYLCETGHCCGETGCCTYYYELWWFWLLWTVLILFSCCCAYRHRRAKLRVQQEQRQREVSLLAYRGAGSYPSSMLDLSFLASLKLPSYEEVAAQPSTPPPPYSSVFTAPRYPQPPRTAEPHLLTQHDPLLHRPLSDGPSSLSSDNSSSCSCDSCCPSSPCSSSLSVPVTYETDTSHASTPSEAAPLTLDIAMETVAAAATRMEANQTRRSGERPVAIDICDVEAAGPQEPVATETLVPNNTVTVAIVTRAASPQSLSSPPDVALPVGATAPLDLTQSPHPDVTIPSITVISTDCPDEVSNANPSPRSPSSPSTPTATTSDSPTATKAREPLNTTRTLDTATIPPGLISADGGRTAVTDSACLTMCDLSSSLLPAPASSNLTQAPVKESTRVSPTNVSQVEPASANLVQTAEPAPGPAVALVPPSPRAGSSGRPGAVARVTASLDPAAEGSSGPAQVPSRLSELASHAQAPALMLNLPSPAASSSYTHSCPAINIEAEASLAPSLSPPLPYLPSPPLPSPPNLLSASVAAPVLLLNPLTALHQPDKGGSSGHASSLSPSPRATQSPPKQTLFSPCVDIFEPGPPTWEEGEDEQEEGDNDDNDDEDMGADESQYRHRRLTGDSGIEVCRCRVDEEEEEEEEKKEGERKKDGWRGGAGEKDTTDVHDSVDCPARGQIPTGEGLTVCNPSTATPTPESGGVVMETA